MKKKAAENVSAVEDICIDLQILRIERSLTLMNLLSKMMQLTRLEE